VALQTEYEKVFTKFLFNINYPIYLVFGWIHNKIQITIWLDWFID
jgi:hypothetical protein